MVETRPALDQTRPRRSNGSAKRSSSSPADRNLIEALANSKVFQDYERAFTESTGMPVALRPVETWQLPHHGKRNESPFCAIVSEKSRACASCLQVQEKLSASAINEAQTLGCPGPLRYGGASSAGRSADRVPADGTGLSQTANGRTIRAWPASCWQNGGFSRTLQQLREAYFDTRVVPPKQHEALVKLLAIFAQHLSMLSNQVVVQHENAEPPVITRAKEYIHEHQTENLRLGHVAKAVNTSTFYFCKMFKKVTGINFTDYLSRVRIEKSKNLLLNPNLRVSEIAFEVGFQSLTHFNRVFKKIVGQSPTEYRTQLLG